MKVLFLTNLPTPYRVDFFNKLGNACDLTVLYERKDAKNRNNDWLQNDAQSFNDVYLSGTKVGNDSAISFSVLKWLRDKSYDLIIVGGYSTPTGMLAIEYLNFAKKKYILNCDGGFKKNDNFLKFSIKKHFISKASAWLSTSTCTNEYLSYYGADDDRIFKYPFTSINETDILNNIITKTEKDRIKDKLGIKESKMILTVGQFIHRKGFDILINSSKEISEDIAIYIIGDEPTEEYLELVKNLGLKNVYFLGFKTKDELKQYYMAADLFVLPTREDIWGLVINEAMSYGLPVITTDRCGAGVELIEDNISGFIVPVENKIILNEKITQILSDDVLQGKMAQNNLQRIKAYTINNMAQRHLEIFQDISKQHNL